MRYFIGIDSSTTTTKALLIDEQGKIIAVAATVQATDRVQPGPDVAAYAALYSPYTELYPRLRDLDTKLTVI